ncbi:endolytic peptidoglycan transglycosylase RlpA [Shimwellia pseudoproteus]|uniref:endolytic peptidoglycan transglycosylase RlpA n=1 Tax=Shimwellia pseudoproteus TaxID=570012 RepID=UPI0018EB125B|nr:endolytic peptidoglycan transglycosylase RlpA [Shimwellia pseudoproteus]MBJ3814552.1 endolytic peptidoglycan transglycosylase RlpA [Shimwellia pseudoproteus]
MRKQWLGVCVAAGLLAACSSNDDGQQQVSQQPQPVVCNGPAVEISGADPHYEPLNPSANQDYQRDGKNYKVVQDPSQFTQSGLAAIYDAEPDSNLTASGEAFDPTQLTAAHPTLPIPSYARITNLANGRMIIVRINDRGPYGNDRVISLSRAAADRLNTSNNTKVKIDPIIVGQDGSLSGPGMACVAVAKQTYALPARPDLSGGLGSASSAPQSPAPQGDVRAISNDTLTADNAQGAPVNSGGFLGAPSALRDGVIENNAAAAAGNTSAAVATTAAATAATAAAVTQPANSGAVNSPVTAPGSVQGSVAAPAPAAAGTSGQYVVQVGAVSDAGRAAMWQQKLSQQFGVPGRVSHNGAVYRVQMGPFTGKTEAMALQQRLLSEAQQQSFVTAAAPQ